MSAYNDNNPPSHYRHDDDDDRMQFSHFSDFESRLDIQQHPASSSQIHPHPHPLFTCQENMNSHPNLNRSLDPQFTSHHSVYHSPSPFTAIQDQISPHNQDASHPWPPYDPSIPQNFPNLNHRLSPTSYASASLSGSSLFAPVRLSPPAIHIPLNFKAQGHGPGLTLNASSSTAFQHRPTLTGSLDPSTGIFIRPPEHPRLRTAQACEKCRTRKAKCSGEHPSCKRCLTRNLVCEYAKEGRVRGPNKPKPPKGGAGTTSSTTTKKHGANALRSSDPASEGVGQVQNHDGGGSTSSKNRHRTALSDHSSSGSDEHHLERTSSPIAIRSRPVHSETEDSMAHSISPISPFPTATLTKDVPIYRHLRRDSFSMTRHRSSRPRLHLDPTTELLQLSGPGDSARSATSEVSSDMGEMYRHSFHQHPPVNQPEVSAYQFQTSDMTYDSGASTGPSVQQQNHPDFLPHTGQAPQIHEFHRVYLDTSVSSHHPQPQRLLDLNHVQHELGHGGPHGEDEQFLGYPPVSETYLHHQQQHQRSQTQPQPQKRFHQRPFDSRSSGLDIGMDDKDIKQDDALLSR